MAITKRLKQRVYTKLFERSVKEVVEGAELEWRGAATLNVVNNILEEVGARGSQLTAGRAKGIVASKAYKTGNLYRSIKAERSIFTRTAGESPVIEFLVTAGDTDDVTYAFQVEAGRYYKKTGTRVPAVPFMRQAFAFVKPIIRRMFISKLRRQLT